MSLLDPIGDLYDKAEQAGYERGHVDGYEKGYKEATEKCLQKFDDLFKRLTRKDTDNDIVA